MRKILHLKRPVKVGANVYGGPVLTYDVQGQIVGKTYTDPLGSISYLLSATADHGPLLDTVVDPLSQESLSESYDSVAGGDSCEKRNLPRSAATAILCINSYQSVRTNHYRAFRFA